MDLRQPRARDSRRGGSALLLAAAVVSLSAMHLAVAPAAQAELVVNGGFETGCSAEFCSPEPPWAQLYHGVDVVNQSFFAPHSGSYSVDLNSYSTGGIIQNLATTAGHQYALSFWMAGNPDPNKNACSTDGTTYNAVYKLNLIWGGTTIDSPIFDNSRGEFNAATMGWTQHTYTVTAAGSTTSLEFDSVEPGGGACGPTIDDVSVTPTVVAPPTITKVSPKKGPIAGGTTVTITGTNFTGGTAVKFGSTNATSFTVNSAKSITAVSPAGTKGQVEVKVTTPGGISAASKKDHFKFKKAPK
jgi:IPT/TIG domain/Protein of unknown function (DUF642)